MSPPHPHSTAPPAAIRRPAGLLVSGGAFLPCFSCRDVDFSPPGEEATDASASLAQQGMQPQNSTKFPAGFLRTGPRDPMCIVSGTRMNRIETLSRKKENHGPQDQPE